MKIVKEVWWFVKNSLWLDYKFFRVSQWSILKKVDFLILKYLLISKHFVFPFTLGKDYVLFEGKKIYYDTRYGIAGYQSLLARHQHLMAIGEIHNPKCIVDIGANVGFFSRICIDNFPDAKLYTIEPIPQIFDCLSKNFRSDRSIIVSNIAISDEDGQVLMTFDPQDSAISQISETGGISVVTQTLDSYCNQMGIEDISVLKIDTESYEAHVLKGASRILENTEYLFLEITMENNNNYTISSLLSKLYSEKYDFQLVAFRNYADVSQGKMPIMDALLKNILYKEKR